MSVIWQSTYGIVDIRNSGYEEEMETRYLDTQLEDTPEVPLLQLLFAIRRDRKGKGHYGCCSYAWHADQAA